MSKTDELISKLEEALQLSKECINCFIDRKTKGINPRIVKINKLKSEISSLKELIKKEATLPSDVKEDKLKGIIREVIWQYCYGKGGTDALFNYKDIEAVVHDVTELYFQPE